MDSVGKFDAENAASSSAREDPFSLQDGVKSEGELSELRKRKRGKKLEMFHRKQNDVCLSWSSLKMKMLTYI
jgi:hypothetical protein